MHKIPGRKCCRPQEPNIPTAATPTDTDRQHMNNDASVKTELQGRQRGKQRHGKSTVSRGSRKREDSGQTVWGCAVAGWTSLVTESAAWRLWQMIPESTPWTFAERSLWCLLVTYPSSERWGTLDFLDWSRRFTVDIVCESVTTPSHASTVVTGPKEWGHPVMGKKLQTWRLKRTFRSSWINHPGTFCCSNRKLPSTCKLSLWV